MFTGDSSSCLMRLGFRPVGMLTHKVRLEIWWNSLEKAQLLLVRCGQHTLMRGSKHYFVRAISAEGETWARDIGQLHDYLENHFPEMRLAFSHFRDVSGRVAEQHVRRRAAVETPTARFPAAADLARMAERLEATRADRQSLLNLAGLAASDSGMLSNYLRAAEQSRQQELAEQGNQLETARRQAQVFQELQRAYVRDGSAASLVFSICSPTHVVGEDLEFADAIVAVTKDLRDADRFEVTQKLSQGRLNIQVCAADDPSWAWVEEWLGGSLSPRQLERLAPELKQLRDRGEETLMVTPDAGIVVDGQVKEEQKLLGARTLSSFLRRIDQPSDREFESRAIETRHLPAKVGLHVSNGRAAGPCSLPLLKLEHVAVSGSTGAGKSVFVRVLIEEAALRKVNVLVLDPRNQGAGLLVPEDRPELLGLYPEFKLSAEDARAFSFSYFSPGELVGSAIPSDMGSLASGLNIVSFKGLGEAERCSLFSRILDAVFLACTQEQTDSLRLLVIVEEAQLFTKRRVDSAAREEGARAEGALDRIIREGRKYGICAVVASQSIKDFSHDVASIRQNTNTKVFFRNADREVEYAADFVGDGRKIIGLPPGTCMIHNAALGVLTIRVRPPFSKLWEFSAADTRKLLQPEVRASKVSEEAQRLLRLVREHHARHDCGLNLSELGEQAGITSKRRLLQLLEELERTDAVRTKKLRERGQPRIIEPVQSSSSSQPTDRARTEGDPNVPESLHAPRPATPNCREDEK